MKFVSPNHLRKIYDDASSPRERAPIVSTSIGIKLLYVVADSDTSIFVKIQRTTQPYPAQRHTIQMADCQNIKARKM